MVAGKGITGGYLPIAVTFATEDIYKAFYDDYENLKPFSMDIPIQEISLAVRLRLKIWHYLNLKTLWNK